VKLPRFFGKKRGHRRTGSQIWGSVGEGLFYAALVAAGLVFGGLLVSGAVAYAPADAEGLVLDNRQAWWLWLLTLLIPGALLAFGGSGLARVIRAWGKSEERRAASVEMPALLDKMGHAADEAPGHPGVPTCEDLVNSPGTILRYRLPIESPESWTLLGFGLFALLWNAVVLVLAVGAGLDLLSGRTDWLLLAILVPFVAVGVGGIFLFGRALLLATAVGPTQVEISDHPLIPGGSYDVLLSQGGTGTFRELQLLLETEELATFRQGTDTRTERIVVRRERVKEWHDVQLAPGARFETHVTLAIPADGMHSFASDHNAVKWRLVVRGRPERRPAFTRIFPLVVFPAQASAAASTAGRSSPRQESP
jgi:hypothetical protein